MVLVNFKVFGNLQFLQTLGILNPSVFARFRYSETCSICRLWGSKKLAVFANFGVVRNLQSAIFGVVKDLQCLQTLGYSENISLQTLGCSETYRVCRFRMFGILQCLQTLG